MNMILSLLILVALVSVSTSFLTRMDPVLLIKTNPLHALIEEFNDGSGADSASVNGKGKVINCETEGSCRSIRLALKQELNEQRLERNRKWELEKEKNKDKVPVQPVQAGKK